MKNSTNSWNTLLGGLKGYLSDSPIMGLPLIQDGIKMIFERQSAAPEKFNLLSPDMLRICTDMIFQIYR